MSEISEALLKEVLLEARNYVIKMNYHKLYPEKDNIVVMIDEYVKSPTQKKAFEKDLLERNFKIIKTWTIEDGREIMIIDDLYADYTS